MISAENTMISNRQAMPQALTQAKVILPPLRHKERTARGAPRNKMRELLYNHIADYSSDCFFRVTRSFVTFV